MNHVNYVYDVIITHCLIGETKYGRSMAAPTLNENDLCHVCACVYHGELGYCTALDTRYTQRERSCVQMTLLVPNQIDYDPLA